MTNVIPMGSGDNLELRQFFEFVYGDQEGFAYSPTKDGDHFEQYFFKWPSQSEELINHVRNHQVHRDVYFSPGLLGERAATKSAFKGSYLIWCEFDGTIPDSTEGLPEPSLKLRSSTQGHEHWYWRLNTFVTDGTSLEKITQKLAYTLGADMACWNANRVLRPPGTTHQESQLPVRLLRMDPQVHPIAVFDVLPDIPFAPLQSEDIKTIPPVAKVIAKYAWPDEATELFFEKLVKGTRSSGLTKLGHFCIEMGMNNAETLSILYNADDRWDKFTRRKDRKERLLGIINYCRSRHPVDPVEKEIDERLKVYTYEEFINTEITVEWVIPDLLHKKGLFSISGPPGVGKSQVSLRFAQRMAEGQPFLKWQAGSPLKTLFVSMEMPHEELYFFLNKMKMENSGLLRENMLLMPVGSSIRLNNKKKQADICKTIEKFQPEGLFFDSFGKGVMDDINSEKIIFEVFDFIDRIRHEYGVFVWFVHHPRKGQAGNKRPNALDDLYGSQYYAANVGAAVGLWPVGPEIQADCLKLRLAEKFESFKIRRTPDLDFQLVKGMHDLNKGPIMGGVMDL